MKRIWKWFKNNLCSASFVRGAGSAFNMSGDYHNFEVPKDPFMADKKAIMSDWRAIGNDLRKSMNQFESGKISQNLK